MGRFTKGQQPGPGRPLGRRNNLTLMIESLKAGRGGKLLNTVWDKADAGDMYAAALLLPRLWPAQLGQTVELDLPPVETSAGLIEAQAAVVAAMARGEITPAEAASVSSVLETQRRAIETHDHTRRIDEMERQLAASQERRR